MNLKLLHHLRNICIIHPNIGISLLRLSFLCEFIYTGAGQNSRQTGIGQSSYQAGIGQNPYPAGMQCYVQGLGATQQSIQQCPGASGCSKLVRCK